MAVATALAVGGFTLLLAEPASAQDKPIDPDPWRFNAVLYGWAINVTGNVKVRNQSIDTNASFFDLVQRSDSLAAFMGYFEADKGRAGFYVDLVYTRLGFGAGQLNYRNPLPGLRLTLTTQTALTYQMFVGEIGGVFEVARWPGSERSFTALDALGGFRYWNLSADATFDADLNVNVERLGLERNFGLAVARADSIQWVDPLVGLRLRHQFTPNQSIFVRGDIGGFGLASSITWQAVGAYSYAWQFTGYEIAAVIGFRALGVNYSVPGGANGFALNEVMYGPIIGVSFRF
jgi:hypothetical protein